MRRLITCMGELLVDFLPIQDDKGQFAGPIGFKIHPGGSPFNVALGLARLEQQVAFAGKISSDLFGRFLLDQIKAEGIDPRFLLTSSAPCTLAFVAMEGGEPAYAFYDTGAADSLLILDELPPALFEETGILAFGSISLLRGTTPVAVLSTVERLEGHALLVFDPNIRPGLVREEAEYRALLGRLFTMADIIKISTADIAWLLPDLTLEDATTALMSYNPALLVVTHGSQGVLAIRNTEQWTVPGFAVHVVDTVGAGDAFTAGLLASLASRKINSRTTLEELQYSDLATCLRFASATAALTCTRHGADPPVPSAVARFLEDAGPNNKTGEG